MATKEIFQAKLLSPNFEPLNLKDYQISHSIKVNDILMKHSICFDRSAQGSGKSIINFSTALEFDLPIMVIAPATAILPVWTERPAKYGVKVVHMEEKPLLITYDLLGGKKKKGQLTTEVAHGLLYREDRGKTSYYYPTSKWLKLVNMGILLILDECQLLKNVKSKRAKAARALVTSLLETNSSSKVVFTSGSMVDQEDQVLNYLQIVGIVKAPKLYTKYKNQPVKLEGLAELQDWGLKTRRAKTEKFIRENSTANLTGESAKRWVYRFFQKVMKEEISSAMANPVEHLRKIKNLFCEIPFTDQKKYIEGVQRLAMAVNWNPLNGTINRTPGCMGDVTNALKLIHLTKIRMFCGLIKQNLATPRYKDGKLLNHKIVAYINFYIGGELDLLLSELKEFNPVEYTGRIINLKAREQNRLLFQQVGSPYRVIITNPRVGGVAVDFNDVDGSEPRDVYDMVSYDINLAEQLEARTNREGTKSETNIYFVWGYVKVPDFFTEMAVFEALTKKGKVMEEINQEHLLTGHVFHGNIKEEILPMLEEKWLPAPINYQF